MAEESAVPPVPVPKASRRRRLYLWWAAGLLFAGLIGLTACLAAALYTEAGSRLLIRLALQVSPYPVEVSGWRGRLLDRWQIERFELRALDLHVEAQGVRVDWQILALRHASLELAGVDLDRLRVWTAPSAEPAQVPQSLRLPVTIKASAIRVGELQFGTLVAGAAPVEPDLVLSDLAVRGLTTGAEHRLEEASVRMASGVLKGAARVAASHPFVVQGRVEFAGDVESHPLTVKARASGTLEQLRIEAQLASAGRGATGTAALTVQPFAVLPLRQALVDLRDVDPAAFHPAAPQARLDLKATLTPSLPPGLARPIGVEDWGVSGPIEIRNHEVGALSDQRLPVERLAAALTWQAGSLQADGIALTVAGAGHMAGRANWRAGRNGAAGVFELDATLRDLDPAQIWRGAQATRIAGTLHAAGETAGRQSFDAKLTSDRYRLDVDADLADKRLTLRRAELGAGDARVTASGQIDLAGDRDFSARGRITRLDPQAFVTTAPKGDLNLEFDLAGRLQPNWQVGGRLTLAKSSLADRPVAGRARLTLAPGFVRDADVDLAVLGNRLSLSGAFGLPGDRLNASVDAPELGRLWPGLAGRLSADGAIAGTLENPSGEFRLEARQLTLPGEVNIGSLDANGTLRDGRDGDFDLRADVTGVGSAARGQASQNWVRHLVLVASGKRKAHVARVSASVLDDAEVELQAQGGWDGSAWHGSVNELRSSGPLELSLREPAALLVGPQRVFLGEAALQAGNGSVVLQQTEWTPTQIVARGKLSGVQVGFSLDEFQRTVFRGRSLQLGCDWDVTLGAQPRGLVRIYREAGDLILEGDSPVAMGLENLDVNLAAQDGRLVLSALANGTRIGSINAVVTAATRGSGSQTRLDMDAPLAGSANVAVPSIAWIGPLLSQNLSTEGSLRGEFRALGTPAKPVTTGRIEGERLGVSLADQGLRLADGRLALAFDAARVRLEELFFKSVPRMDPPDSRLARFADTTGTLSGTGEVQLPGGEGRFALTADKVAVLQNPESWVLVSGRADLLTGWEHIDIDARVRADAGFVGVQKGGAPQLGDDVVIRGRQPLPAQRMRLSADVAFDFGERFLLNAYGIDTYLNGQLRIRMAQGQLLRASGSVRASEGVFDAYGQKLAIERGIVNFQGPLDNPGLNIVALRKGQAVEAGVEVTGTAQRPRVRLVSDPNVPESEKLSWILLGRASEAGSADAGLIVSAAGAALGGDGESLGKRIARGFGLDEVSLGQASGGSRPLQSSVAGGGYAANATTSDVGGQVLALGKRLSTRAYLGFERNLLGTSSVVRLSYALSRYFSLVARAGTDNSLDLDYSISFK